ncbi:MAG: mechanosensitive ion channel family protein [Candidatus Magasanikbacteria bacterium]|jgi:small-conductance mechanosensitive channel|nr:mechanosensitive ion channel family protein [Candidatus Magasanikbacteria bacterium]
MWQAPFFISDTYWGNDVLTYAKAIGLFCIVLLLVHIVKKVVIGRIHKMASHTKTHIDDMAITAIGQLSSLFYLGVAILVAMRPLALVHWIERTLEGFAYIGIAYGIIRAINAFFVAALEQYLHQKQEKNKEQAAQIGTMLRFVRVVISAALWGMAILLILSNSGFNVTSLIASLGIGGIAIALALQNILGDLFSSFSLLIDKPFQVGDFIIVGENSGTVQHIGLKTSRLQTLKGSELIIPNRELTSSTVQNYKKMKRRRDVFTFGIIYETSKAKIAAVPEMIKVIIDKTKGATFGRAHFFEYGESSLNFEVVYHVEKADYGVYMDIRQHIHMELHEALKKKGIEFAYPTQVVKMQKG